MYMTNSASSKLCRELFVRIEMCPESSGMDFSRVDSGPLR